MLGGCYVFYFYFYFALRTKIFSEKSVNQLHVIKSKKPNYASSIKLYVDFLTTVDTIAPGALY